MSGIDRSLSDDQSLTNQESWEKRARLLLDDGQNFLVHDTCRAGLRHYPGSHKLAIYGAIALSQTGADAEARRLLEPVLETLLVDKAPFNRLEVSLKKAMETAGGFDEASLAAMVEMVEALERARGRTLQATADSETYAAIAQVYRESWLESGGQADLELFSELYLRAFQTGDDPKDGIHAATALWFLGQRDQALELAARVVGSIAAGEGDETLSTEKRFELLATRGVAELLLGRRDEALASFCSASAVEGIGYQQTVALLKQLSLFKGKGIEVPSAVDDLIKPPQVVVFTGHELDRPGKGPHFPPGLEAAVRAEIAEKLEEIDARIGFSMASCGSELLFVEAMLERGGEVNLVLPFAMDDYIATNVRYGGARWEMRFRNAVRLAATITFATEERYLGHDSLYRFANQCLQGLSTLRAGFLYSHPTLLAVWDMMPGSLVGGAGEFIDQWEDITRLRLIDLDGLLQRHPELLGDDPPNFSFGLDDDSERESQGRVIRSMMFCDIAGYSRLAEEYIPVYLEFLQMMRDELVSSGLDPKFINTWGDAIFVVMDTASPMAEYALTLQKAADRASEALRGRLPHRLNLRISLHTGPVFESVDPICGRMNFYGSHINRAARLEPVTVIGHVYATQQFVAVLTAEQSALRAQLGEEFEERYVAEYVGQLSLAKDFGRQVVYHLRRKIQIKNEDRTSPSAVG